MNMKSISVALLVFVAAVAICQAIPVPAGYDDVDYPYAGPYESIRSVRPRSVAQACDCKLNGRNQHRKENSVHHSYDHQKVHRKQGQVNHDTFIHFHRHGVEHFYPPIAVLG